MPIRANGSEKARAQLARRCQSHPLARTRIIANVFLENATAGVLMATDQKQHCDRLCYARDVCRALGITSRTLNTWITAGRFPAATADLLGRRIWPQSLVEAWQRRALEGAF